MVLAVVVVCNIDRKDAHMSKSDRLYLGGASIASHEVHDLVVLIFVMLLGIVPISHAINQRTWLRRRPNIQ